MAQPVIHDVVLDSAGVGAHRRYTCRTCNDATLVCQPYMAEDQWLEALRDFLRQHGGVPREEILKEEIPKDIG